MGTWGCRMGYCQGPSAATGITQLAPAMLGQARQRRTAVPLPMVLPAAAAMGAYRDLNRDPIPAEEGLRWDTETRSGGRVSRAASPCSPEGPAGVPGAAAACSLTAGEEGPSLEEGRGVSCAASPCSPRGPAGASCAPAACSLTAGEESSMERRAAADARAALHSHMWSGQSSAWQSRQQ